MSGSDYNDKAATPDKQPRVWAIASYRAGENSQIFGLVSRLPFAATIKRISYSRLAGPMGLLRRVTSGVADLTRSDSIAPPWPDLIVSAGVKNEPLARWIRAESGGRTRLVFLGRTWASRRHFDLVVTTPQYRLPEEPNVLHNLMTQHGVTHARLAEESAKWEVRYGQLPGPRFGVLLGGDSGPYVFGPKAAARLADALNALASKRGGSVIVTSSARTRVAAFDVLEARLTVPHDCHRFRPGDSDNPYFGILASADELVVTSDSIAMLSEAAATGKLVHVVPLRPAGTAGADVSVKALTYRLMMKLGPERLSRDLSQFHDAFIAARHGVWLGDPPCVPSRLALAEAESTRERVLSLL